MERPLMRTSVNATEYDEPPLYGIQSARRLAGTLPPSTIAPTLSERHIEKTLGAAVSLRSESKRVCP